MTIVGFLAATLGPYLWTHPEAVDAISRQVSAWTSSGGKGKSGGAGAFHGAYGGAYGGASSGDLTSLPDDQSLGLASNLFGGQESLPIAGAPVSDFSELFRFDATPQWVTSRWARVTAFPTPEGWQAMRVPVVTGTQVDDLAGSLTFYFDSLHQVQRITFKGSTGDVQRLVAWSTSTAGLKRETTLAAELYTRRWSGRATAVLAIQNHPVMRSSDSLHRFDLLLELNPPKSKGVSSEVQEWLALNRVK